MIAISCRTGRSCSALMIAKTTAAPAEGPSIRPPPTTLTCTSQSAEAFAGHFADDRRRVKHGVLGHAPRRLVKAKLPFPGSLALKATASISMTEPEKSRDPQAKDVAHLFGGRAFGDHRGREPAHPDHFESVLPGDVDGRRLDGVGTFLAFLLRLLRPSPCLPRRRCSSTAGSSSCKARPYASARRLVALRPSTVYSLIRRGTSASRVAPSRFGRLHARSARSLLGPAGRKTLRRSASGAPG